MSRHSAVCDVIEKGNSCDAGAESVLPVVNVSALLRSAAHRLEYKLEAVGREAGYEPSYWARVLSCERGILLDRLGRLPLDVQREWVDRWRAEIDALEGHRRRRPTTELDGLADLIASRRVRLTVESL